jgi:phosphoribosylamine--glycine ligase
MGAYAPVSLVNPQLMKDVEEKVLLPTLRALEDDGSIFQGLLYAGIMLTHEGPKVVEFNCRFGDPETQAILPLLSSSLLEPIATIAEGGSVAHMNLQWRSGGAVTTVLASEGYPGGYEKGKAIELLPSLAEDPDLFVFHAGTRQSVEGLVTSGGRVLAVTGLGDSLGDASRKSLVGADAVNFDGKYFRTDIGWREFARDEGKRP